MSTNREFKGWVFKHVGGEYYLWYAEGGTGFKDLAYIYTTIEAEELMKEHRGWGTKAEGKWIAVYA